MSIYTRNARNLIEELTSGRDPYSLSIAAASTLAANILMEAWSPERQRSIEATALKQGMELKDHLVVGDYDLGLWYTEKLAGSAGVYLVSINNAEHDPMDKAAQTAQQPGSGKLPLDAIKAKVAEWVEQHGSVIIGSYVVDRNKLYLRLFKRVFPGYKFQPFFGDYKYGFVLSRD